MSLITIFSNLIMINGQAEPTFLIYTKICSIWSFLENG
eukprot:UN12711